MNDPNNPNENGPIHSVDCFMGWFFTWFVRIMGIVVIGLIFLGIVQVIIHISHAGGQSKQNSYQPSPRSYYDRAYGN